MLQKLSPQSGVPAYQQIVSQIKHAIELGQIEAGEPLPSIRQLAETIRVNPNTVIRAFRELEHEGVVEIRRGSGVFVTGRGVRRLSKSRVLDGHPVMRQAVEALRRMELSDEIIRRIFEAEVTRQGVPQ
jgi:GntR family transcriptional regulator